MSSYRQALQRVAERTRIDPDPFGDLERRRQRRHRNRRIVAAVVALAVAGVGTWGALALADLGYKARPGGPRGLRTATAQGVTLSFPDRWMLIQLGNYPRSLHQSGLLTSWEAVLQLSNYRRPLDPGALCPESQSMPADGVLLYIQRDIATGSGLPIAKPWPIVPQVSDITVGGAGGCGLGYHQYWRVGDRRFAAMIAFGPKASAADREALLAAFRSLDFRWIAYGDLWVSFVIPDSWDQRLTRALLGTPKEVLASVTSGGRRFTFSAMPDPRNLFEGVGPTLAIQNPDIGPLEPPERGEFMLARRYSNDGHLLTVVGSITPEIARLDVVTGGRTYRATLVDFPRELPGAYRGYFFDLDEVKVDGGQIIARDAQGHVLQSLPLF